MASFRAHVLLSLRDRYSAALKRAAGGTRQFGGGLKRAAGAADVFGRRTDHAAKRAWSALAQASGRAGSLTDALRRTGRAGQEAGRAAERAGRWWDRSIERTIGWYRQLGRAADKAGRKARRTAAGPGGAAAGAAAAGRGTGLLRGVSGVAGVIGVGSTGALAAATGREQIALEARLTRLRTDAGWNEEQIGEVRRRAFAAARAQGLSVHDILADLGQWVSLSGGGAVDVATIDAIAEAKQAFGTLTGDLGTLAGEAQKRQVAPEDAFAVTGGIGRLGSMPLADLARVGSRLFGSVGGQLRLSGLAGFGDLIAAIQAAREVSGSSEQAVTRLEALAAELTDAESRERITRELGVRIMDRGEFRPLRDLLREIARAAKRDPDALGRAFTAREARVLFTDLLAERGMEKFESYLEVNLGQARADMNEMARLNAETAAAAVERFKSALSDYAGRVAMPVAQWAGDNPSLATVTGAAAAGGIWWGSRRLLRGRRGRTPGTPGAPDGSGSGLRTMRVQTMRVQTLIARGLRGGAGVARGGLGGGKTAAGGFIRRATRRGSLAGSILGIGSVLGLAAGGDTHGAADTASPSLTTPKSSPLESMVYTDKCPRVALQSDR